MKGNFKMQKINNRFLAENSEEVSKLATAKYYRRKAYAIMKNKNNKILNEFFEQFTPENQSQKERIKSYLKEKLLKDLKLENNEVEIEIEIE